MSNLSQTSYKSHEIVNRNLAEIKVNSDDAAAKKSERNSCAEYRQITLRKGRRACNECRQQKVRLPYLAFESSLEKYLSTYF